MFSKQFVPTQQDKKETPPLPRLPENDDMPTLTRNVSLITQTSLGSATGTPTPVSSQPKSTPSASQTLTTQNDLEVFSANIFGEFKKLLRENQKQNDDEKAKSEKGHIELYTDYVKSILLKCDRTLRQDAQHAITQVLNRVEDKLEQKEKSKNSPFAKFNKPPAEKEFSEEDF